MNDAVPAAAMIYRKPVKVVRNVTTGVVGKSRPKSATLASAKTRDNDSKSALQELLWASKAKVRPLAMYNLV